MWSQFKTILVATLVTALVWIFAEAETLARRELLVELEVRPAEGVPATMHFAGRVSAARVSVTIEGATGRIEAAERALREGVVIMPGVAGVPAVSGEYAMDVARAVRELPDLQRAGVSVARVVPATITVQVEALAVRTVPVVALVQGADVQGTPTVRPANVSLLLPKEAAESVNAETAAVAEVDARALERLVPGREETISGVILRPPAELARVPGVRVEPRFAEVTLTVKSRAAETVIKSVPVHVRLAPGELSKWDIEIAEPDRAIVDVRVTGPVETIQQIESRTLAVVAVLALSFEELERGITSKEVSFGDLPTSLKFEAANRVVRVKITRRAATSGGN